MKKNKLAAIIFSTLMSVTLLTGCGSSSRSSNADYSSDAPSMEMKSAATADFAGATNGFADEGMVYEEEAYEGGDSGMYQSSAGSAGLSSDVQVTGSDTGAATGRKLIRTVNLTAETLDYEPLMIKIKQKVDELGGYFENLSETRNSYGGRTRYANMIIRVPRARADELITCVENDSNITSRDDSTNDVTLDYVDMESHKKSLQTEQKRLLELLERAETVEDIITLESRISDVRYQIESMESQLRTYDNKIDYTTVYLNVSEVEQITPEEEPSFGQRIREGLEESIGDMADGFVNITVWFISSLPYLLFMAVIVLIIVFAIIRPIVRKSIKNGEKRRKEYQEFMLRKAAIEKGMPDPGPSGAGLQGQAAPSSQEAGAVSQTAVSGEPTEPVQ